MATTHSRAAQARRQSRPMNSGKAADHEQRPTEGAVAYRPGVEAQDLPEAHPARRAGTDAEQGDPAAEDGGRPGEQQEDGDHRGHDRGHQHPQSGSGRADEG